MQLMLHGVKFNENKVMQKASYMWLCEVTVPVVPSKTSRQESYDLCPLKVTGLAARIPNHMVVELHHFCLSTAKKEKYWRS